MSLVRSRRFACMLSATLLVGAAASGFAAPSTNPESTTSSSTSRPSARSPVSTPAERAAESKANTAVSAAVRELLREFGAGVSGSRNVKLRTSCDYFTEHPAPDVTPKAIVAAIDQKISEDARAAAYVKWQLLSGLGGTIDEKELPRALHAYHNAPPPIAQPGETQDEQTKYELMRRNSRKDDVPKLNQDLAEAQQQRERDNAPILAFRNELFAKLPEQNYDVLRAGFEDAYTRMKAGVETQSCMEPLIQRTREWMVSSAATQPQLSEMSRLVTTLSKENSPRFYSEADWDQRAFKVTWHKKSYDLNKAGQMEKLAKDLAEIVRSGPTSGGGLKFKDDDNSSKKSKNSKSDKN